ncbi:MAG: T9SS type A sorting domain-containing protein [Bacteroidetes bacterium]|nr:T9SS type A sorting domain-containing protein [Bacteroidota bacterium]
MKKLSTPFILLFLAFVSHISLLAQPPYPVAPNRGINLAEWDYGTTNEIWEVSSLANLWWIAAPDSMYPELNRPPMSQRLHTFYYQTVDINAFETQTWFPDGSGGYEGFIPIGGADAAIYYYDGRGCGIYNLYINRPEMDYVGLFGCTEGLYNDIMNLSVGNVNITGRDYVGGLIGRSGAWSNIANSLSEGSVSGRNHVGGLVGKVGESGWSGHLTSCYSIANVNGNMNVGGLVGWSESVHMEDSYAAGSVNGTSQVGGLIGYSSGTTVIEDSFWDTQTSGQSTSAGGIGKTTDLMKLKATFTDAGWNFETEIFQWMILESNNHISYPFLYGNQPFDPNYTLSNPFDYYYGDNRPENMPINICPGWELMYANGNGTSGNPYQITDWIHLHHVRSDLDAFYVLNNDLVTGSSGYEPLASATADEGAGWLPIGEVTSPFTGNFNGNGHTINGLWIIRPSDTCVGLFGRVNTSGSISNVGLTDINITGNAYVGGLVGVTDSATYTNVYASGIVSGYHDCVGGLAGAIIGGTFISAYASGTVTGWGDAIGGLVGSNNGSISNSYSTANVNGISTSEYVAGLVALNGGTITNSYATGLVSGESSYAGGLVGGNGFGTITSSFWDTQTSGQTISAGGEGKTTNEMKNVFTYITYCWDFQAESGNGNNDCWGINTGYNSGYPFLSFQGFTNTATYPSAITIGTTASPTCGWSINDGVLSASMDVSIHVDDIKTALVLGNLTIEASDEIIIGAAIAPTLTAARTLTLKTDGNILINAPASIVPSTEYPLNTIFWSDMDGTDGGYVMINSSTSINTKGGHLWIGGGSGSEDWNGLTVGNSCSKSTSGDAVALNSAIVSTSGGELQIKGESTASTRNSDGIVITAGSMNTGSGNISLYGIGGQALGAEADCDGIRLDGPITTTAGNITLTGASTTEGLNEGIAIQSYITSTSGNISLITNIFWMDAASIIGSGGYLTLKPFTDGNTIGIAGGAGTLSLPTSYFTTNFVNGFSGITIGSSTAGNISITALPFNDQVTFNAAGNLNLENDIDLNGQTITLGNEITLDESFGKFYGSTGSITTTRSLNNISSINVAGLGAVITTVNDMGSTTITRGHTNQSWGGNNSILRYYDIAPTYNTGLNATLVFNYSDTELNSLNEAKLFLYKSTDGATTYSCEGGTVNTTTNTISLSGISDFSRWMAAEIMTLNWNGEGSDFNTSTNWTLNETPSSLYNLNITNVGQSPVVNDLPGSPAVCNDLTIASGAELTIAPGKALTVTGTLINNGTLTLSSTSSGTGSLIAGGNSTGTITSQRYLPGANQVWHMVGAPVSNMSIAASGFEPGSADDFYAWHEPSPGTWVNYKTDDPDQDPTFVGVNGNDNFIPGMGYLIAYNEAIPTKTFTGTLNIGSQTFTLKNSSSKNWSYNSGWNLLGNPYSSAIDWNLVDHDENTSLFLDDFAYAYDPQSGEGAGAYIPIDGSAENAYIAANQGFFVIAKTSSNDQTFSFTNAMQTHGGIYYKNTDENDRLVLRLTGELYYDETTIRQRDGSTFNKDRVDAFKMNSFNVNAPNVYSISEDNINLAINSIPEIGPGHTIRLGMLAPKSGLYKIQVVEASSYMMDNNIYLEDQLLSKWHKISESVYSFTTEAGDISDRFVIHFGVVGIEETAPTEEFQLWTNNSTLNLHNPENITGELRLYNMMGQIVEHISLNRNTNQQINLFVPDGFYIVNIVCRKQIINKKVYLR